MNLSRRRLLGASTFGFTMGVSGLSKAMALRAQPNLAASPFGAPVADPNGVFDLPEGFGYTVIGQTGQIMSDGLKRPRDPDGMAAYPGEDGQVVLMVNHENNADEFDEGPGRWGEAAMDAIPKEKFYDLGHGKPLPGGVSALIYDEDRRETLHQSMRLLGTVDNCAGGPSLWNSWLTCEEDVATPTDGLFNRTYEKDHGYVFDVAAPKGLSDDMSPVDPVPLKAMGRFNHEAIAMDPKTGIVYLTEDRDDGLFFRFIPDVPGRLAEGGKLQALVIKDMPLTDMRNWEGRKLTTMETFPTAWIDMEDVESPKDDLRYQGADRGAALFARGEGMWFAPPEDGDADGSIFFACTSGGRKQLGQIWRYTPSPAEGTSAETDQPGSLSLFIESEEEQAMNMCDNLTVTPFKHLFVCEDGYGDCGVIGATPKGELYTFGRNMYSDSEIAGACFSPSGKTLFINIQKNGVTLAIHGPWERGFTA